MLKLISDRKLLDTQKAEIRAFMNEMFPDEIILIHEYINREE